jgi:class 3 adenylate cyclase/predicted ATPase
MDVADWLRSLGLGQFADVFRDNGVDSAVLPKVTVDDLKEMGVAGVGHRRKIISAIEELNASSAATAETVKPVSATSPASVPKSTDSAERRQVTVMFSDLVGSTALSARLDPEDLREIISAYQKCVTDSVRRFDGFLAKYMGDGVLVYFGYPLAHEDDAERAVRTGLELIAAVSAVKSPVSLQTRVGIATGLVVVGDLIGSGEAQERGIVGETPNLAARLQGVAEPNMVVIAEGTRQLLGNLFELQDLGAKDLKGIAGPARAFAALRASSAEGRFEAMHGSGLTDLVGREEETELLLRRWSKAKINSGQTVLLSGEAGIGKSRLTAALLERVALEPHTRLRYFCSPQHTDSAFYPIIGQMERASALTRDDTPQAKLDKLDALLARTLTSIQDAALLAELLSLPNDGRYPALDLTPQQRRQRTMEALTAQLGGLASQQPVLMIFEDVHWIDPTSLEVLNRTMDRIKSLPVLLVTTFRPEFNAPWTEHSHVTSLTLNRLGEHDAVALIQRLVANRELPREVMAEIVERTDGIPLFVEEMTKAVMEAENEGAARRTVAAVPSPASTVPASLHASLMARLDRLGSAKEVAQIGSAIGREFSHTLLAAVISKSEAELELALDRLVVAGLLFRQGDPPHATYIFKHALVQDAAYGTLLRAPRRALHARIAETFESQFTEIAENQPELLARHFTAAGQIDKAARFWGKAGQRSLARSALVEAAEQVARALDQIATLPATPALRREQIKLQVALATTLFHVKGYTRPETIAAFEQADALMEHAESLGELPEGEDALLRFSVMYGQWTGNFTAGNFARAAELARQFLAVAERQARSAPLLMAHRVMGGNLALMGDLQGARLHLDRAVALYAPEEHKGLATKFGQDIGVAALFYRSLILYRLGYPESALKDADRGLKSARDLGLAGTVGYAVSMSAMLELFCGRFAIAEVHAEELLAFSEKNRLAQWKALSGLQLGWIFAATNRSDEAVELIEANRSAFAASGAKLFAPYNLSWLARARAACGRPTEAKNAISEAFDMMSETGEKWDDAEIHRTAGEIALVSSTREEAKAEEYFQRALGIARAQQGKSWELRAATSLARLWRDQGKRNAARDLLAPVYGWFTEGLDTLDLKEARALLDSLA